MATPPPVPASSAGSSSLALGGVFAGGGGLYLTGEDNLRINTWGSVAGVTLAVEGRLVGEDGALVPLAEVHTPNSDRTLKQSLVTLACGWLTHVQVRVASGTVKRGQVFVSVELMRGRLGALQSLGVLAADYVAGGPPLGWPASPVRSPLEGPGVLRSIAGTDPAAGAEISETVPTGARWRLLSFGAPFVTSATVANRQPRLIVDDGANILWSSVQNVNQTAGATWNNYWAEWGAGQFAASTSELGMLPRGPVLMAGFRIRTSTLLLDAADNWGAPQYLVEEWIEP